MYIFVQWENYIFIQNKTIQIGLMGVFVKHTFKLIKA